MTKHKDTEWTAEEREELYEADALAALERIKWTDEAGKQKFLDAIRKYDQ